MSSLNFSKAPDHEAISQVVHAYIDGYLGQDAPKLRGAFLADAKLMATADGAVSQSATSAWFDRIEAKRRDGGGPLSGSPTLLGVDQTGDAAVAKVHLQFAAHEFFDYLSLLKTSAGWQIVNKIYTTRERHAEG